jgi:hypothetical protein
MTKYKEYFLSCQIKNLMYISLLKLFRCGFEMEAIIEGLVVLIANLNQKYFEP